METKIRVLALLCDELIKLSDKFIVLEQEIKLNWFSNVVILKDS